MRGINIWFAETFEQQTAPCKAGITEFRNGVKGQSWVKSRPIGLFHLTHRLKCAWEVFTGKADIIRFYKQ